SVQDPVLAVTLRPRLHVGRVGTTLRFGEPETAYCLTARHQRQPTLLLFFRAKRVDGIHDEAALNRYETPKAAVAPLQLLADQPVRDAVETRAVVALDRAAEQPEFCDLGNEFPWKVMVLECLLDYRDNLRIDELADRVLHHALLVGQL